MKYLVFVYGTLKSGHGNNGLLTRNGARLIGQAFTGPDYILRDGGIPFLCPTEPGKGNEVQGEVWEVDAACLLALDRLEGHPSHYTRELITVRTNPDAWAEGVVTGRADGLADVHCYLMKNYEKGMLRDCGGVWTESEWSYSDRYREPARR